MSWQEIKWGAILTVLIGLNAGLIFMITLWGVPPWAIIASGAVGAAIGIRHDGKNHWLVRALAGIAGGIIVCFGLTMSIFFRLLS